MSVPARLPRPFLAALLLAACSGPSSPGVIDESRDPSPALAELADEFWQAWLVANPGEATFLGDRRFDDRLRDIRPQARAAHALELRSMLDRARILRARNLNRQDLVTLAMLEHVLQDRLREEQSEEYEWSVDPLGGPQVALPNLLAVQTWKDAAGAAALVTRVRAIGPYLDAHTAALRRGLAKGRAASRTSVQKVLEQVEALVATPPAAWPLVDNAMAADAGAPEELRAQTRTRLVAAVQEAAAPAFGRYRDQLRDRVLPDCRSDDQPGLVFLPGGDEIYRRRIRSYTSLELTAEELHDFGQTEIRRIRREITELGRRVFNTRDFAATQQRLMTDPGMFFTTREEVETKARETLERAERSLTGWFGIRPQASCVVKRIPAYEEAHTTMAYYRGPAEDGSRPGVYWSNTYRPEIRPRYNAEVLAFHEAIPGHHLQIAIATELQGIPAFRRHLGSTAYVEGWALYTERLCEEMDLYTSELDRFGVLGFDAWRASRLVVDTGLHAFGWSREQAIRYMTDNTLTAAGNIINEVDRYIAWPGQALAYKVGQREILELRAEAEEALAEDFQISAFHDVVLRDGAVTLPALRANVQRWVEEGGDLGR